MTHKTQRWTRRMAAILLTALAALAAGCAVDNARETAVWREPLDEKMRPPAALAPDQVLTLGQAIAMANSSSEQLALSGEDYLQALIDRDRAVSRLLPTISLAPSFTKMDNFVAPAQVKSFFPIQFTDVPASAALHLSATDVANVARAEVVSKYQLAVLLNLQSDILVQTTAVYHQVLLLERQIRVLENSVKVQEARVADMRDKERAGTVRPLDVSQTEAEAAGTRSSLLEARNRLATARAGLAFLVGLPSLPNPLADDFRLPPVAPLEALQAQATEHRQDLLAADALVSAADRALTAAVAEYFPSLSVDFSYFLSRQSFPPDSRWLFNASMNLPIFSGGRIHANVRTACSLVRQAHEYQSLTRRQVAEQVEVAYGDLRTSGLRLKEFEDQVEAARQAFGLATDAYDAGAATNLEPLIAQDRLRTAELQLAAEQLSQKTLYFQLVRQTGLLVDEVGGGIVKEAPARLTAEIAETAEREKEKERK